MREPSRLSNEEAKDIFEKLGIPEKADVPKDSSEPDSEDTSDDSDIARLLKELSRSDIGRRPPRHA